MVALSPVCDKVGSFIAGTPIKTDNGDVPIEQIQVGDLVWSIPESGQGEPEFKRVLRTMVKEEQEVVAVSIARDRWYAPIFCTKDRPFLVADKGWIPASDLEWLGYPEDDGETQDLICLADGSIGSVQTVRPVCRTAQPGVVWVPYPDPEYLCDQYYGDLLNINTHKFIKGPVPYPENPDLRRYDRDQEFPCFKATVYNLEVEDFHTYNANGVWVHNHCLSLGTGLQNVSLNLNV